MTADELVAGAFLADHPDDAARMLEHLPPADVAAMLGSVPAAECAAVFRVLGPAPAAACAAVMDDALLAAVLDELPLDDAAVAVRGIELHRHDAILSGVTEVRRDELQRVLAWEHGTAGAMADPLVLTLTDDLTVAEAQKQLRNPRQHLFYYLYVVTRTGTLVGALAIPELMSARPRASLRDIMQENPLRLDAAADLATVAVHPAWRDFDALPVVDTEGRFVGAIRHKTVRRLGWTPGRPLTETLVRLSEVYWAGLSGMLHSLTPPRAAAVTPPGAGGSHGS